MSGTQPGVGYGTAYAAEIERAAEAVRGADALLIGAGAGMGVDSGLPDFRGPQGFWRAYPQLEIEGLQFEEIANPAWFDKRPRLAWGFYGHRLHLYRETQPHIGFYILKRWFDRMASGGFVFTSNVDGQFQKAGFGEEWVAECHGSIHHAQCVTPCSDEIWSADNVQVRVDEGTLLAEEPLPKCLSCGALQRPNILMFSDGGWITDRTQAQEDRLGVWLGGLDVGVKLVVVECGAGTAIPSVRHLSERVLRRGNTTLVRINPRESQGPRGTISLPMGSAEALARMDGVMGG